MFELLVAAKLLLTAPQSQVGSDRAKIESRFGRPEGVGTDYRPNPAGGVPDRIVTLDWPQLRIRLFLSNDKGVSLVGVTTTTDVFKVDGPVHLGTDRGTILRELGGPFYEDADQLVYSLAQDDPEGPAGTVRIVLTDDRVVGMDWTYPLKD